MPRYSTVLSLLTVSLLLPVVWADTYDIPPDYRITCLDAKTGKALWHARPDKLYRPEITLVGDVVIAKDRAGRSSAVNAVTGETVKESSLPKTPPKDVTRPLAKVGNLQTSLGYALEMDKGNTRALVALTKEGRKVLKKLEDYPEALCVHKTLAIFTFGSGEVSAYDLKLDRLAWEVDASTRLEGLAEGCYSYVTVTDGQVLLSVDQAIVALDAETGKFQWATRLPRQEIRRYDSPWTKFSRLDDVLFVDCYDALFALRLKDGKLLWSFDCGFFGEPWPTVKDGRVYVATREGKPRLTSFSLTPERGSKDVGSAVEVARDPKSTSGYAIKFLSRRDIPAEQHVWSSLRPPPKPTEGKPPSVVLRLTKEFEGRDDELRIDLTSPLAQGDKAYAKFSRWIDKAVLIVDGVVRESAVRPDSRLAR